MQAIRTKKCLLIAFCPIDVNTALCRTMPPFLEEVEILSTFGWIINSFTKTLLEGRQRLYGYFSWCPFALMCFANTGKALRRCMVHWRRSHRRECSIKYIFPILVFKSFLDFFGKATEGISCLSNALVFFPLLPSLKLSPLAVHKQWTFFCW